MPAMSLVSHETGRKRGRKCDSEEKGKGSLYFSLKLLKKRIHQAKASTKRCRAPIRRTADEIKILRALENLEPGLSVQVGN
jgi:hypothetical protein